MHIVEGPWIFALVVGIALGSMGCSASGSSASAAGGNAGVGGSGANSGGNQNGGGAGNGGNVSSDYQPVAVTNSGLQYTIEMGPMKMVIDAGKGARVTEFSFKGSNVLKAPDASGSNNYGTTFWPSPQSSWYASKTWPPIPQIDSNEYTGSIEGDVVQLTSSVATLGAAAGSQFTVTKRFKPVPESGAIDITYTISNQPGSVAITVAPWEISRVKGLGGLTFFGKGADTPRFMTGTDTTNFVVTEANGIYWYKCTTLATSGSKCFADGAGWLAHVTASNILFLLTYPDIQPSEAAEGEAEIEFYNKQADGDYVELEPQGASTDIAPGESLQWTVRWKLREVPSNTTVEVGSADLASFMAQQKSQ